MKVGIIVLDGQGDRFIQVVPHEWIEWINRAETPGRKPGDLTWRCEDTPMEIQEARINDWETSLVLVTSGSYQNDRALGIPSTSAFWCAYGNQGDENLVTQASDWCRRRSYEVGEIWRGHVY